MGGVEVPCLVDTGSMVSTISESFFLQKFEPWGQERLQSCHWLQLRAANGLAIPYLVILARLLAPSYILWGHYEMNDRAG